MKESRSKPAFSVKSVSSEGHPPHPDLTIPKNEMELTHKWLDLTTDGVWDWNLLTDEEYLSPRFKKIFGYNDDELPNHASSWQKIIHPDDLKLAQQAFKDHIEKGKPYHLPVRYYHKDGFIVWVLCRGVALKDETGRYTRMIGTHTDITGWKQAEEEFRQINDHLEDRVLSRTQRLEVVNENLSREIIDRQRAEKAQRENEERLSGIIASAMDAIITIDENEIITVFNAAAENMFLYEAKNIIGKKINLLIPARFHHSHSEHIRAFEQTHVTRRTMGALGAISGLRSNGEEFPIEASISQIEVSGRKLFTVILRDITDRKKSEEMTQRFIAIIESTDDAILSKTLDGKITSWNPSAEKMFGYTAQEIIGRSVVVLFPPDRLHEEENLLDRIGKGERIHHFETVRVRKDGRKIDVSATISPIKDTTGKIIGASKVLRDITEQKKSRQQLALLHTCVSNLNDIVLVMESTPVEGPGPRVVFANAASERITGYTSAETVGHSVRFFQSKKTDPAILDEIRTALKQQKPIRRQIIIEAKDGAEYQLDTDIVPIFDQVGRCTHFAAIQRDVTQFNHAMEQTAEQAALLDKAQDAILVRDLEGRILFWNKGAERMYHWTSQEAVGQHAGDLIYKDIKPFEEANKITREKGEWSGELQHITKDRRELTVEARWSLVRDKDGQPKSILAINTDITEKKKIEAQFMRAQRMESIGTLAGGIAHDLNNILAPIMLSIGMLKATSNDPDVVEILDAIESSAKRGSDIVGQVLSFARGMDGQRIEIQSRHLLKDIERIIKDTFPKDIRLQISLPNDLWTILGDPTQIHQILLNLCVNARDAMPHGGNLAISIENRMLDKQYVAMNPQAQPGPYVVISVMDSGTGIPHDVIDKVFEPFFTTKEIGKGTGLGLSTVTAIVKSHGGFINVYSEPGQGTTFKIYLPAQVSAEDTQEQAAVVSLPRGNGETILVVDDENSILTITSQTLQAFGYRVIKATDGAEAVAIYAQQRNEISVVLTDMMMPVMDGPATIHALLKINPALKIIAASGLNANGSVAKAVNAGIKHFLSKPYTAETLLKTLRTILEET